MDLFHGLLIISSCYDGFTGALCQIDINECRPNPCQNGGTCSEPFPNMYVCQCPANFEGPQCLQAIDPCIGNSCKNGATCVPNTLTTGYTCSCVPGTI